MPWKEESIMSQRAKLIELLSHPHGNVRAICEQFGVSRKTAYKWKQRYQEKGLAGLQDRSRKPHAHPLKVNRSIEELVLSAHQAHPYWGPYKLKNYLTNIEGKPHIPSHVTVGKILERNGCEVIKNNRSHPARIRFERESANDLWQMDFKGRFMTGEGSCHPLTILDDYSRYSICLKACRNEQTGTVKTQLIRAFREYGLPNQINVDNGTPWGTSRLSLWWSPSSRQKFR